MKNPGFILVGFGSERLTDLMSAVKGGTKEVRDVASLSMTDVPHYRSFTASSQAEQQAFVEYMDLMLTFTKEGDST